jgi:hypothetical protein
MYKKLDKSDVTVRPFKAHKRWTIQNISSSLTDDCGESTYFAGKIVVNEGLNISGTFYTTESAFYDPIKEPINSSGEYKRITYSITKSMFYETSDGISERFGVERFCACPISQKEEIRDIKNRVVVGRINKDYWGEKISPGSVRITDYSDLHNVNKIIDDKFTNLVVDGYDFPYTTALLPRISSTTYTWNTSSSDFYFRGQPVSYETAQQIKSAGGLIDYVYDDWVVATTSVGYQPQNERFGESVSAWNKYVVVGAPAGQYITGSAPTTTTTIAPTTTTTASPEPEYPIQLFDIQRTAADPGWEPLIGLNIDLVYQLTLTNIVYNGFIGGKHQYAASFDSYFENNGGGNIGWMFIRLYAADDVALPNIVLYNAVKTGTLTFNLDNPITTTSIEYRLGYDSGGFITTYETNFVDIPPAVPTTTTTTIEPTTTTPEPILPATIMRGSAFIYKFDEEQRKHRLVKTVRSPFTASFMDGFGQSVSVNYGFATVGSPLEDIRSPTTGAGAVYVYDMQKGGQDHWGLINILEGENIGDKFGWSVSNDSDVLAVGAPGVNNNSGAVYVYRKKQYVSGSSTLCNTASMDEWQTVYSEGDGSVADGPADSGSLLYNLSPAPYFISGNFTWQLETTISGGVSGDNFGYDVSISDDRLLVGTYVENGPGYAVLYTASYSNQTCPTASWVAHKTFSRTEEYDTFVEATTLGLIKQNHNIDYFGSDVSIDGDHFAICSPIDKKFILNTTSNETGSFGAAYFYSFDYDRECKEFNVALRYKSFGDVSYKYNNNFAKSVSLRNGYAAVGISADQTTYSASMSGSALVLEKFIESGVNAQDEEKALGRVAIYQYDSSNIKWNLLNTIKRIKEANQPHYNFGWSVALGDQFGDNMYVAAGAPIFNDVSVDAQSFITDFPNLVPATLRGSAYVYDIGLLEKNRKIGNVFYKNGVIAITSDEPHYFRTLLLSGTRGYEISYKGTQTIFENEYLIRISPGDFNYSTNPSAIFNYPLYFDINSSGFFDNQDVDLILKYLNKQKIYLTGDDDNGIVFEQSTKKDDSWWNNDVLQTESEDVLNLETVVGFVFLQQSIIDVINKNLINTGILDIDGNGIIDMRDGALLLHYAQKTLTNEVVKKYIDNDSTRREFKDVKDYLDKYTGKRDFDVNSNFLSYIDDSAGDVTGSYLAPYITSIGLYSDENELVAVGKLANPIKNLIDYPVNISVRFDT